MQGKGLRTREEENPPAMEGLDRFLLGQVLDEQIKNLGLVAVGVLQPGFGGLRVVFARPPPPPIQFQFSGNPQKEFVGGHGPTTKKMLRHPIVPLLPPQRDKKSNGDRRHE